MDRDGGLSERERQDAEREADHQARGARLARGATSTEETEKGLAATEAPKPKPKTASRKTAARKTARTRAKSVKKS